METREILTLTAPDGFQLKASHFPAVPRSRPSVPSTLIAPATGVPGSFYHAFAAYLASLGSPVLVIDYRYSGQSYPAGVDPSDRKQTTQALIQGSNVNIDREWRMDMETGLKWVFARYQELGVVVVGASVGGHLLPLIDPTLLKKVERSLWVGAMSPSFVNYSTPEDNRKMAAHILDQTTKRGYFPGRDFGFGNDITAGVGRQWFGWMESPTYLAIDHADTMARFKVPVVSLSFTDDLLTRGNAQNTDRILESCTTCPATRVNFDPEKMGWPTAGHVNAFAPNHAGGAKSGGVWQVMSDWLLFSHGRFDGGEVRDFNGGALVDLRESKL